MSDLRILVAAALNASDLSSSDLRETHLDRIGALAFADPLGGALWSLKWGGNLRAYGDALELLVVRAKSAVRHSTMRPQLCQMAISEWYDDRCVSCGGKGIHTATALAPVRPCETCAGTGRRPVSEQRRAHTMGLSINNWRRLEPVYAMVERKLVAAEDRAWVDIAGQLGRFDNERYRLQDWRRRVLSGVVLTDGPQRSTPYT